MYEQVPEDSHIKSGILAILSVCRTHPILPHHHCCYFTRSFSVHGREALLYGHSGIVRGAGNYTGTDLSAGPLVTCGVRTQFCDVTSFHRHVITLRLFLRDVTQAGGKNQNNNEERGKQCPDLHSDHKTQT
ncbi:uncharacterized protein LOC144057317 isoform X2 [Vanacampus margaritifer]